jgi:CRISPR-associated protein Csm3
MAMKLMNISEIKGKIILQSGLHIGAGDMEMRIGGVDNPVIRHPHTLEPYIPGSSIKGKVRSLLKMESGFMAFTEGKPVAIKDLDLDGIDKDMQAKGKKILKIFGTSGAEAEEIAQLGPTRVSFADCPLDESWKEKTLKSRLSFTEVKSENAIDRIRGVARDPRFTERVVSGAQFSFSVILKQLDQDDQLLDYLLLGLKLLELDALGGSGSRGYGRIAFKFADQELQKRFDHLQPFAGEAGS